MIRSVYVNGLKSLKDFKLDLQPGLNVLVGPNGSGKSNILTAIELISKLSHLDTLNSSDKIGTTVIEELFDKFESENKIDLVVEGEIQDKMEYRNENNILVNEEILLKYTYGCTINFDPKLQYSIFYDKQNIEFNIVINNREHKSSLKFCNEELQIISLDDIIFNVISKKSISDILKSHEIDAFTAEEFKELSDSFIQSQLSYMELRHRSVIYELSKSIKPLRTAINEMETATIFNIDPESIRNEINKMVVPKINKNGGGLLSALLNIYEINNNKELTFDDHTSEFDYSEILETIKYSLKKISLQIKDLRLTLESENGNGSKKIVGNAVFENGKELPIALLSDGSLKWLTLVTALLINEGLFVLEEPENYFHPTMQQLFIELMRETLEDNEKSILFTTHSETILDKINPEEVILTYFAEGYTVAKTIEEPQKLNQAIHDTGFGLGWYFVTGEFDQENVL